MQKRILFGKQYDKPQPLHKVSDGNKSRNGATSRKKQYRSLDDNLKQLTTEELESLVAEEIVSYKELGYSQRSPAAFAAVSEANHVINQIRLHIAKKHNLPVIQTETHSFLSKEVIDMAQRMLMQKQDNANTAMVALPA